MADVVNGYCLLTEVKSRFDITSIDGVDDGVINDMITQTSRLIDLETRTWFYAETATKYFDTPDDPYRLKLNAPLLTITTLTNGNGTALTSGYYKLYPLNFSPKDEIRLLASQGVSWSNSANGDTEGAITVAGTWGECTAANRPADITAACLDIVVTVYRKRYGVGTEGAATITGAGVVITPKDITEYAERVLSKYRPHL